ncbi:uncharacterized protein LOC106757814 [Vigna radiata var. radiata]|uniref:Uncharacterized protein LOC106757814 n=1 Tax=Vigna radiata var. radiata TaxID=3916 RepID=A0A1S3TQQ9_VIGRR|nr:uncharacterized protein LOC106757814 [Vigna radiata var. radiata]
MDMCSHDNFVNILGMTFSESLHIEDAQKPVHDPEGNDICSESDEKLCGAINKQETKVNMMCLTKSATFPTPNTTLPSSSSDEEANRLVTESLSDHTAHQTYSRSISLPAPLKLVSAMKGSREKHGGSQVKLNVKWAPDVYDPIPTLLSHTVRSNKKQQKSRKKKPEKKNGKKGQKGNSSRGGGGNSKDKQFRKMSATSGLCYKSMDSCEKVLVASTELDALDSNCGTSFLKKSVTEVHYSVAEAL